MVEEPHSYKMCNYSKMLEQAKQYFNATNHTWVAYDIDTSLVRNAENKEGVFFDFGELRKIKNQVKEVD